MTAMHAAGVRRVRRLLLRGNDRGNRKFRCGARVGGRYQGCFRQWMGLCGRRLTEIGVEGRGSYAVELLAVGGSIDGQISLVVDVVS